MNILITGGCGYIGSKLVDYLSDSDSITIVDNLRYNQGAHIYNLLTRKNVTFINKDVGQILYPSFLEKFDTIVHLAAIVGAPACDKNEEEAININLSTTTKLVDILNQLKHKPRLIFPNTNSGYGKVPEGICTEETPLNAISLYGKTKDLAEQYIVQNYNNYIIFRLATVFGYSLRPRLDLLVNNFIYLAYFDKEIKLFEGNFRRNYISINDVVRAIEWAFFTKPNEVYNLGNNKCNCTKLELAEFMQSSIGCKITEINEKDPDQRDYEVSNEKIMKEGFIPRFDFLSATSELLNFYSCLPKDIESRNKIITPFKNI